MKKRLEQALLLQLVLGGVGLLLNMAVVLAGYDQKGLLKSWYIPGILLILVGIAVIVLAVLPFYATNVKRKYSRLFPAEPVAAAGLAVAALCLLVTDIADLVGTADTISTWRCITGILGSIALGYCSWCRFRGSRPVWLCWAVVTVHMLLVLIAGYQSWSREGELVEYGFQFLACVNLALFSYQQAAADGGVGSLKHYLIHSLICVGLCPIAMMGSGHWLFYLSFWVYHVLNLYYLNLKH